MKGVEFPEQTVVFGKPKGWQDQDCYGLPVAQTIYMANSDGHLVPCLISCWELTDEDLDAIIRNRKIYLSITGVGMPPVSLYADSPFPPTYDKEAALKAHMEITAPPKKELTKTGKIITL